MGDTTGNFQKQFLPFLSISDSIAYSTLQEEGNEEEEEGGRGRK